MESLEHTDDSSQASEEVELGIDERIRRELARYILDEEAELPLIERFEKPSYKEWTREDYIEYGRWLCRVIDECDDEVVMRPPNHTHFAKAASLGLGPGLATIYRNYGSLSDFQAEIVQKGSRAVRNWTKIEMIDAGIELAAHIKGRISSSDIIGISREGNFPSLQIIKSRFGSLTRYYELIGQVHPKSWDKQDYIDWGVAFMRQNNGMEVTSKAIDALSSRGVSPSRNAVSKNIGNIGAVFRPLVVAEYEAQIAREEEAREIRLIESRAMQDRGELPADLAQGTSDSQEYLRIASQYRLVDRLAPNIPLNKKKAIARYNESDKVARWLTNNVQGLGMGEVEVTASMMGIFDDLWPMYRFQNVDLKV